MSASASRDESRSPKAGATTMGDRRTSETPETLFASTPSPEVTPAVGPTPKLNLTAVSPTLKLLPLHRGDVDRAQADLENGEPGEGGGGGGLRFAGGPEHTRNGSIAPLNLRNRKRTMPPLIRPEGESGRRGFHPVHFLRITLRSASLITRSVNILWPVVPAAIVVRFALPDQQLLIFILSYIAMVPCANLVGFAGQELARKVSHVYGVLVETTFGSVVEIIMFIVLLTSGPDMVPVILAAILGSILATLLLCLGLCFIAGGIRREETEHNEAISEVGSGLLLVAGVGLAIPALFKKTASGGTDSDDVLGVKTLSISRITAVLLMLAYFVFTWFQAKTHQGIYDAIFEHDQRRDSDRVLDRQKHKMTIWECAVALAVSIALVTIIAITLVQQIHFMVVERGISDSFMGLILVPLVEKAAEHLTAVDEAWDDQMNFALSHVMGATLQTALFNGPLIVIIGWGLDKPMGLDFHLFDIAMLILSIITVGNFLRDGKTNYLEGFLSVIVYIAIAVAAWHYPNPAAMVAGAH